jgi:hypothetical protein
VLAFGFVTGEGTLDNRERRVSWANFFDLHLFAFEQLVILKETAENQQAVRR